MGNILSFAIETTQAYGTCAAKHQALAEWLNELKNNPLEEQKYDATYGPLDWR